MATLTIEVELREGLGLSDAIFFVEDFCTVVKRTPYVEANRAIDSTIRYLDGGSNLTVRYQP